MPWVPSGPWPESPQVTQEVWAERVEAGLNDHETRIDTLEAGGGSKGQIPMRREGTLATGNGPGIPTPFAFTLTDVEASLDVAGSGSNVVLHVWKNGVNVQTITFVPSDTSESISGLSVAFARGDKYALRINSVDSGATASGASVTLGVVY